jgi:hypothetical protein
MPPVRAACHAIGAGLIGAAVPSSHSRAKLGTRFDDLVDVVARVA